MKNLLLTSAIVAFTASAAVAEPVVWSKYYISSADATTKKCTIVDKKPTTTTTIVDNGVFKTRTEAETGMKTMKIVLGKTDFRSVKTAQSSMAHQVPRFARPSALCVTCRRSRQGFLHGNPPRTSCDYPFFPVGNLTRT